MGGDHLVNTSGTGRLAGILDGLQAGLEGALRGSRAALAHPGAKGEASEENWLKLLKGHLPFRYQADKAFVIDSRGSCSDQIDVVIYDRQYSPLLYNQSGQQYVPAESVYAVFEVKQDLSRENIIYAGDKAASVRGLYRTSAPVPHVMGVTQPRPLHRILAGILTYQSSWTPALGSPLRDALASLSDAQRLSLGCALVDGTFEVECLDSAEPRLTVVAGDRSLIQFVLRLLKQLHGLATVPAIDYEAYLSACQPVGEANP